MAPEVKLYITYLLLLDLVASNLDWKAKYDKVWKLYLDEQCLALSLPRPFNLAPYSDYDYEDDVRAYIMGVKEWRKDSEVDAVLRFARLKLAREIIKEMK